MRIAKSFACLPGILLLLLISAKSCNGLCNLVNGTMARCNDLDDAKYIDTYDLKILKTSVTGSRLHSGILRNFPSLQNLDLSSGELEHIEPGTFRELHELRSLDLSHNKISILPSTSIDGLKNLRNLNIRRNAFDDIPSAVLKVKNLKALDLTGNPLKCNCANLKIRDELLLRGVHLSKRVLCAKPSNLKGKPLLEPEVQVICMFEKQDAEMQMDQPDYEGSGETNTSDDPFDASTNDELNEEVEQEVPMTPVIEEIETPAPTKALTEESSPNLITPIPSVTENPLPKSTSSDEIFFSEENDRSAASTTIATSTKLTEEIDELSVEVDKKSLMRVPVEGSGEEEEEKMDEQEGSGIEGSGTGVPPISWDVPDDETAQESSSSEPGKTTEAGFLDLLFGSWGGFGGTSAAPEEDTKKDLGLEEEQFIISEATPSSSEKTPVKEKVIVPSIATGNEGSLDDDNKEGKTHEAVIEVGRTLDDPKLDKVKAEDSTNAEASDASATRQPKKGMGSYVVLAALLAVLVGLIGFAAYKGDFCRKKRKRNDPEGGTELKDMSKSLLDSCNGAQPKISSNGNLENVPLVSTPPIQDDSKIRDDKSVPIEATCDVSRTSYSAIPDVIDPIKPPRKSFVPHDDDDEPERLMTNGNRSQQDLTKTSITMPEFVEPVCLRIKGEPAMNGNNNHNSVSSLGTESRHSPSIRTSPRDTNPTNGSLGIMQGLPRPPLSPGAQRVKITLQENPDSVPKTPILITRTKAGENLVKTP